jgi:hypothetical protein
MESNRESNVIELRSVNDGRFAHTIYQEDVVELKMLSREFSDARAAWEAKRDFVKAALRAGAAVEPGALTVALVKGKGGGFNVQVYDYEKVVVR